MSSNVSVAAEVRNRVEARLKELEPLVQEYEDLRRVASALEDPEATAAPPGKPASRATPRRRMRSAGAGAAGNTARAAQALELVRRRPGITVAELADELGIGTTYLYRLMPRMDREGKVRKDGRGYYAVEA